MNWKYVYLAVLFVLSSVATHGILASESQHARMLSLVGLSAIMWAAVEVDLALKHAAAKRRGCVCDCHD